MSDSHGKRIGGRPGAGGFKCTCCGYPSSKHRKPLHNKKRDWRRKCRRKLNKESKEE